FAAEVMPEFAEREAAYAERKRCELAPAIEVALARMPRLPPLAEAAIPVVEALGRQGASPLQGTLGSRRRDPDRDRRSVGRTPRRRQPTPLTRPRQRRRRRRGSTGAEYVRRPPVTALAAGRANSERVQASSQWTRRWREQDSNHRF